MPAPFKPIEPKPSPPTPLFATTKELIKLYATDIFTGKKGSKPHP